MPDRALPELGMESEAAPDTLTDGADRPSPAAESADDYFVEKDGQRFAGTHLLLELWGGRHLNDPDALADALCDAARAAKATILHTHMHHFLPSGGVSGVVVLAESHISIHTWPERGFAAIDLFMCGACDPYDSIPSLRDALAPERMELSEHRRGLLP